MRMRNPTEVRTRVAFVKVSFILSRATTPAERQCLSLVPGAMPSSGHIPFSEDLYEGKSFSILFAAKKYEPRGWSGKKMCGPITGINS